MKNPHAVALGKLGGKSLARKRAPNSERNGLDKADSRGPSNIQRPRSRNGPRRAMGQRRKRGAGTQSFRTLRNVHTQGLMRPTSTALAQAGTTLLESPVKHNLDGEESSRHANKSQVPESPRKYSADSRRDSTRFNLRLLGTPELIRRPGPAPASDPLPDGKSDSSLSPSLI